MIQSKLIKAKGMDRNSWKRANIRVEKKNIKVHYISWIWLPFIRRGQYNHKSI